MDAYQARTALPVVAGFALLATAPLGAGEPLTMRVRPNFALAPSTVIVDAIAERDPANRALRIEIESPDYYRSSLRELDGDDAPRTTTVSYDGVPGGVYEVRVILFGSRGRQRAATSRRIELFAAGERGH